jgi:hypothetical protein
MNAAEHVHQLQAENRELRGQVKTLELTLARERARVTLALRSAEISRASARCAFSWTAPFVRGRRASSQS